MRDAFSLGQCLYPCFALWYLLCLFYWRMLLSIIPQKWNPKWVITISFLISIAVGFTKINGFMGFHRFFSFMPYFMIGHYYGTKLLQFVDNKTVTPPLYAYMRMEDFCHFLVSHINGIGVIQPALARLYNISLWKSESVYNKNCLFVLFSFTMLFISLYF